MDDAAVARRGAPAQRVRLEERDRRPRAGASSRAALIPAYRRRRRRRRPTSGRGRPDRSGSGGIDACQNERRSKSRLSVGVVGHRGRVAERRPCVLDPAGGRLRCQRPAPRRRAGRRRSSRGRGPGAPSRCSGEFLPRDASASARDRPGAPSDRRPRGPPARLRPARPTRSAAIDRRGPRAGPVVSASMARASGSCPASTAARSRPERRLDAADPVRRQPELDRLVDLGVRRVVRGDRVGRAVAQGGQARPPHPPAPGAAG